MQAFNCHNGQTFNDVASSNWFDLFKDDVDTVLFLFTLSWKGRQFPFEVIQKLDAINIFVLKDIGLKLLSSEDLTRSKRNDPVAR